MFMFCSDVNRYESDLHHWAATTRTFTILLARIDIRWAKRLRAASNSSRKLPMALGSDASRCYAGSTKNGGMVRLQLDNPKIAMEVLAQVSSSEDLIQLFKARGVRSLY
jgi:hypothetical protein